MNISCLKRLTALFLLKRQSIETEFKDRNIGFLLTIKKKVVKIGKI